MSNKLRIYLPMEIIPKERPRVRGRKQMGQRGMYTPTKTKDFEERASWAARMQMRGADIIETACSLDIVYGIQFPKSWPKWKKDAALRFPFMHDEKPDMDNLLKAVKDSFNGIVWTDDRLVSIGQQMKVWAPQHYALIDIQRFPPSYSARGKEEVIELSHRDPPPFFEDLQSALQHLDDTPLAVSFRGSMH